MIEIKEEKTRILLTGGAFSLGGVLSLFLLWLPFGSLSLFSIWVIMTLVPVGLGCAVLGYLYVGKRKTLQCALAGMVGAFTGLFLFCWVDKPAIISYIGFYFVTFFGLRYTLMYVFEMSLKNGFFGAFIGFSVNFSISKFRRVIKFSFSSFLIFFLITFFIYWIFDILFGNLAVLRLHMEADEAFIVMVLLTLLLWGLMGAFLAVMSSVEMQREKATPVAEV